MRVGFVGGYAKKGGHSKIVSLFSLLSTPYPLLSPPPPPPKKCIMAAFSAGMCGKQLNNPMFWAWGCQIKERKVL